MSRDSFVEAAQPEPLTEPDQNIPRIQPHEVEALRQQAGEGAQAGSQTRGRRSAATMNGHFFRVLLRRYVFVFDPILLLALLMVVGSVAIRRVGDYAVDYVLQPLEAVAAKTRVMDDAFINAAGNDVTAAFRDYLRPLLGSDLPQAHRLRGAAVAKVLKR